MTNPQEGWLFESIECYEFVSRKEDTQWRRLIHAMARRERRAKRAGRTLMHADRAVKIDWSIDRSIVVCDP